MCKILLVCNDECLVKELTSKLVFLRCDDRIVISDYEKAVINFNCEEPDVVLIEGSDCNVLDIIKNFRVVNGEVCIILLSDLKNPDFILSAYDCGIDDFMGKNAESYELVVRIVNNMKHHSAKKSFLRNVKILEQIGFVDELSGFYGYGSAKQIVENCLHESLNSNKIFIAISPADSSKEIYSLEKFADAVKKSVRCSDIVILGQNINIYVLLFETDVNGAITVINKIKENYGNGFELCSGIVEVNSKNYNEIEKEALGALSEACATHAEYIIAQKNELAEDCLFEPDAESKNYKIFRQMFNKKLEKVITPIFYSLQKAWEEKLFETEIEQQVREDLCVFKLKNKKQESSLRIIYPGFAKIIIDIVHEGLDSPENTEIQLPLPKVTQKELVRIIENFIKEFKYTTGG